MADAMERFLRKRKDRVKKIEDVKPSITGSSTRSPSAQPSVNSFSNSHTVNGGRTPKAESNGQVIEIKIFSSQNSSSRFSMMKLNHNKDADPIQISRPILMNRKEPGEKQLPTYAVDSEGKIVGKYVYDAEKRPVLGADGHPVVETRQGVDQSLVGTAPGQMGIKSRKKGVKEVFLQDIDKMRMRREEYHPWVLESARLSSHDTPGSFPEHWVGRMQEPGSMPTVLFIDNGKSQSFKMVPLNRTYRFEPERPFKVLDADAANKLVSLPCT
jgi:transcription initiation factor TFIIF subunit alpha